jgi:integrase
MTEVCVLIDGRRIKYSLKRRERDPYFLVCFQGPDGKRKEWSTGEGNKRRAVDSAVIIVRDAYDPRAARENLSWDDATRLMVEHMRGENLRPNTIVTYETVLSTLRKLCPGSFGPASITQAMAESYKLARLKKCKPYTVRGDLNELSIIFGKWFVQTLKILATNPFAEVAPPKVDKLEPRFVSAEEHGRFLNWLTKGWPDWRMPLCFLEVKATIGCRIFELASLPTANLVDGRVVFEATTAKGRKTRRCKLPVVLYDELRSTAGQTYVWERFPEQLREVYVRRGRPNLARCVADFDPRRVVNWFQDRLAEYRKGNPEARRYKLHNLRGTAMSKAKQAGVAYDAAAIAFGCHPETMRSHYVRLDETTIADAVMESIQGEN